MKKKYTGEEVYNQKASKPAGRRVNHSDVMAAVGTKPKARKSIGKRVIDGLVANSAQTRGINEANKQLAKANRDNKKRK